MTILKFDLNQIPLMTAKEASLKLGKNESYVRQLLKRYPNRLLNGTYRKIGKEILITQEGVQHLQKQIEELNNSSNSAYPQPEIETHAYLSQRLLGKAFKLQTNTSRGEIKLYGIPHDYCVVTEEANLIGRLVKIVDIIDNILVVTLDTDITQTTLEVIGS